MHLGRTSLLGAVLVSGLFMWSCGSEPLESDASGDSEAAGAGEVRYGLVMKPDEQGEPSVPWRVVAFEDLDGFYVAEGDIVLEPALVEPIAADELDDVRLTVQDLAARMPQSYWPDGRVPYVIDQGLPDKQRVLDAIAHVEQHTPVQFVNRTNEADYVRFVKKDGVCLSYVGRIGGEQDISLSDNCPTGAVIHEIGHAIGLWHEQSRSDRDQHVRIQWENIPDDKQYAFETYTDKGYEGLDIGGYDLGSIMHYGPYDFSKNGEPTIVRKSDGKTYAHNRTGLSAGDVSGIDAMYGSFDGTFADDDGSVHEQAIEAIYREGITQGCEGGSRPHYCPGAKVTRGQMAVFLTRALDLPQASRDYFLDDNGAWFEDAANRLAEAGVSHGCSTARFCGNQPITRGQMAAFLDRAFDFPKASRDYFSDDDGAHWEEHANDVAEAGVTQGCASGKFCGGETVTRGQMASFLGRALGLL